MAEVGGGFQPDTKAPSSRRADFDLLRRIREVERNGGGNDEQKWKEPVHCATTANITLSGYQTVDNINLSVTGPVRVLVKDQTNAAENGIYLCATGPWTRTTDFDLVSELPGSVVYVKNGLLNKRKMWTLIAPVVESGFVWGTSAVVWQEFPVQPTAPLGEQRFAFPPSVALTTAVFMGLNCTAYDGDSLMDPLPSMPRPSGWGGVSPLPGWGFKSTGLYFVQGSMSLSTVVNGEQGLTYIAPFTRTGSNVGTYVRGIGNAYGPMLYNTYGLFQRMLWVTNTNAALQFSILVIPTGVSTWSSPGYLSIMRMA